VPRKKSSKKKELSELEPIITMARSGRHRAADQVAIKIVHGHSCIDDDLLGVDAA